jgi:hypothetical protein
VFKGNLSEIHFFHSHISGLGMNLGLHGERLATVCAIAWSRAYWNVTTYEKNKWENYLEMDRRVGCKLILPVLE